MKRYIILTALLFTTCEKEEILSPEPTPDNAELFTEIDFLGMLCMDLQLLKEE